MKILFVDDRSKRLHAAIRQHPNDAVTVASNVKDALRCLAREEWDVVSLDHDLAGCDFEDPDSSQSGMEIVRYLAKTGWPEDLRRKPRFLCHSTNIFAGHLMTLALMELGFECYQDPFVYEGEKHMRYDEKGIPLP